MSLRRRPILAAALLALWLLFGGLLAGRYVAPGLLPADAGEFQLVVRELGIAHPPGYPLYTLAAHGFARASHTVWAAQPTWSPLWRAAPPELCAAARRLLAATGASTAEIPHGHESCRLAVTAGLTWPWFVNAFSLLLALLTLAVVYHAGRFLAGRATGVLGVAVLVAMPVFIQQATTASIRQATALLTAAVLALTMRWLLATAPGEPPPGIVGDLRGSRRRRDGWLLLVASTGGLAVTHHPSLAFLLPIVALVLVVRRPSLLAPPRHLPAVVTAVVAAAAPLAYLVLRDRAGAVLAPGDLDTWSGLWRHVTGAGFRGDLRPFEDPAALWDRTRVVLHLLQLQLGWVGVALATVGALWLILRRQAEAALLLGTVVVFCALAVVYRAPQTVEYLMPAHVALALTAAAAGGALKELRPGALIASPMLRTTALLFLAAAVTVQALPTARDVRAGHPRPEAWVTRIHECAAPNTALLASWHHHTPYMAAQHMLQRACAAPGLRCAQQTAPASHYVAPAGAEPIAETWARMTRERLAQGHPSVLLSNRLHAGQGGTPLWPVIDTPFFTTDPARCGPTAATTEGAPAGLREPSAAGPRFVPPTDAASDAASGAVQLTGAWLTQPAADDRLRPAELTVAFTTTAPLAQAPTIVAQLLDPERGTVHGQLDLGAPLERWNHERGIALRGELHPFRGQGPRELLLTIGLYAPSADGPVRWDLRGTTVAAPPGPAALGVARVVPSAPEASAVTPDAEPVDPRTTAPGPDATLPERQIPWPPAYAGGLPPTAIPFGDAMTLMDHTLHRTDHTLIVDLRWRAERAGRSDFTVSVQARGADGLFVQHDGTPASGAYPTLKWLPGQRVWDRHRLPLPPDLPRDTPLEVSVGVYDAFSLSPLPVTDPGRVARGQGQRAILSAEAP